MRVLTLASRSSAWSPRARMRRSSWPLASAGPGSAWPRRCTRRPAGSRASVASASPARRTAAAATAWSAPSPATRAPSSTASTSRVARRGGRHRLLGPHHAERARGPAAPLLRAYPRLLPPRRGDSIAAVGHALPDHRRRRRPRAPARGRELHQRERPGAPRGDPAPGQPPLAFFDRPEWIRAWFPGRDGEVIGLCRRLNALLEAGPERPAGRPSRNG